MKSRLALGLAATLFAFTAHGAEPSPALKYRQATMRALGGHMSAAAAILKGEVEHKGHLQSHLEGVAAASKMVGDLFPAGSDKGETEALPAVWAKPDDFKKAVAASSAAADTLSAALKSGDADARKAAFDEAGKSCKGCHDGFRKKKQ